MKRVLNNTTILLVSWVSLTLSAQHHWIRSNPGGGGAFTCIGAGPSGTILVGSDLSGTYMSTDDGDSWEVLAASRGLTVTHTCGIGFDPNDADLLFIGSESGIFRSLDHGLNFSQTSFNGYVTDIEVSPSQSSVVYASQQVDGESDEASIVRSLNGGLTWSTVSLDFPAQRWIIDIIPHPTNAQILYALTGNGRWVCGPAVVYKSMNGGQNWTSITDENDTVIDFKLAPDNPQTLYTTTINASCAAEYYWTDLLGELHLSNNAGASWTSIADRTGIILLDPDNAQSIKLTEPRQAYPWITDAGTWSSLNGGQTWTHSGPIDNWELGFQPDQYHAYGVPFDGLNRTIGSDMSNPDRIFWINQQWVYQSVNGGNHFADMHTIEVASNQWQSTGIDNVNIFDIAYSPVNHDKIYAAYFDLGFWRSDDAAQSWQAGNDENYMPDWQGQGGNISSIEADPTRINVVWATMSDSQEGAYGNYLVKSTTFGQAGQWSLANDGLPLVEVMGISVAPWSDENNRTMMCTASGRVYQSTNDGNTWTEILSANNGSRFTAFDRTDPLIRYAGGESGFWRSINGGLTWSQSNNPDFNGTNSFWDWGFEGIFDIEADPNQTGHVYATMYGIDKGLYHSEDAGLSWTRIINDDYMRCVSVSYDDSDIIYATSSLSFDAGHYSPNSNGIYYSDNGGESFETVNEDMAWTFGVPVEIVGDRVYVGSPGTGLQWSLIPALADCAADITGDGLVDINDFLAFNSAFNTTCGACPEDITGDGLVDINDFLELNTYFGTVCD